MENKCECGKTLGDGWVNCPWCGKKVEQVADRVLREHLERKREAKDSGDPERIALAQDQLLRLIADRERQKRKNAEAKSTTAIAPIKAPDVKPLPSPPVQPKVANSNPDSALREAERERTWTEITRLERQKNLHDQKERTAVTVILLVLIVGIPAGLFSAGALWVPTVIAVVVSFFVARAEGKKASECSNKLWGLRDELNK
jgi:hypothetical protein